MSYTKTETVVTRSQGGPEWDNRLDRLLEDLQRSVTPQPGDMSATSNRRAEFREYRSSSSSTLPSRTTRAVSDSPRIGRPGESRTVEFHTYNNGPVTTAERVSFLTPANTTTEIRETSPGLVADIQKSYSAQNSQRKVTTYKTVTQENVPSVQHTMVHSEIHREPGSTGSRPGTGTGSHYTSASTLSQPDARYQQNITELDSLINDLNNARKYGYQDTPKKETTVTRREVVDGKVIPYTETTVIEPISHSTPHGQQLTSRSYKTYQYSSKSSSTTAPQLEIPTYSQDRAPSPGREIITTTTTKHLPYPDQVLAIPDDRVPGPGQQQKTIKTYYATDLPADLPTTPRPRSPMYMSQGPPSPPGSQSITTVKKTFYVTDIPGEGERVSPRPQSPPGSRTSYLPPDGPTRTYSVEGPPGSQTIKTVETSYLPADGPTRTYSVEGPPGSQTIKTVETYYSTDHPQAPERNRPHSPLQVVARPHSPVTPPPGSHSVTTIKTFYGSEYVPPPQPPQPPPPPPPTYVTSNKTYYSSSSSKPFPGEIEPLRVLYQPGVPESKTYAQPPYNQQPPSQQPPYNQQPPYIQQPPTPQPTYNQHPPYNHQPPSSTVTTYRYTTTSNGPSSPPYGGQHSPTPPFPIQPGEEQQPPKRLDDLMASFPDDGSRQPLLPHEPRRPPPGPVTHGTEVTVYEEQLKMKEREKAREKEKERVKEGAAKRVPTKNISGPAVYYPPGELFTGTMREGGAAQSGGRMKESYKYSSGAKESKSSGGAVVPICLPLCCAMPCVIL